MTIHIIQPAVPEYRIPFFKRIMSFYQTKIYSTKSDFLGVKTVFESKDLITSSGFYCFFNKIYWHKDLPLYSSYDKGDIVVISGNPRIINYMLLFIFLKLRGVKTVWWGHGWTAGSFGLSTRLRIKLMKIADAVLVYTDKEKMKLSLPNCYALNNGLDSFKIKESIKKHGQIREINSKMFNLVFIGRITEKANLEFLLEAMTKVNKNVCLNIVGSGDNVLTYKKLAAELGVSGRVYWHGAIFDENSLSKIMLSSKAFIYTGSVGLSLIHAFNYGLPAVVHSNEKHHMPEFSAFKEGINGISYEQNSLDDLSSKINELSTLNDTLYTAMSNNAYMTVAETYNTDDMARRFKNMVEAIK